MIVPTRLKYQNETGITLCFFFSETHHCTANLRKKINCAAKPKSTQGLSNAKMFSITMTMISRTNLQVDFMDEDCYTGRFRYFCIRLFKSTSLEAHTDHAYSATKSTNEPTFSGK